MREILRQAKGPSKKVEFLTAMEEHTDSENRNLLHEAALAAVQGETGYFLTLLNIGFPIYGEDVNLDTPGFIICTT